MTTIILPQKAPFSLTGPWAQGKGREGTGPYGQGAEGHA